MMAWIGLVVLVIAGIFLVASADGGSIGGMQKGDFASLITGVALLIFIGGGALLSYRGQAGKAVKDAAIWLAIMLALVTGYSFRHDFKMLGRRVASELMPGSANIQGLDASGQYVVEIRQSASGHYVTSVRVNGAPVTMMVDTGASSVVLTPEDARRAGVDMRRLFYSVPVNTANGRAMLAPVRLQAIFIGELGARNVLALVAQPGAMDQSLLGMSFLSRLRSYEFRDGVLVLKG